MSETDKQAPTKQNAPDAPEDDFDPDAMPDSAQYKALLREALAPPAAPEEGEILQGVQTKLRQRSKGKFYGDGWSVATRPSNVILVALTVVLLLAIAWFALGPSGVSK